MSTLMTPMSRESLYISSYDEKRPKRAAHLARELDWAATLPRAWRAHVVGPLWVEVFRDADARSERWVGYDEDDQACYCQCRFQRVERCLDQGRWVERIDYSEDLLSWRMRDGRWLIHRTILSQADTPSSVSFFAFSEDRPR